MNNLLLLFNFLGRINKASIYQRLDLPRFIRSQLKMDPSTSFYQLEFLMRHIHLFLNVQLHGLPSNYTDLAVTGDDEGIFGVDAQFLYALKPLDREKQPSYSLQVQTSNIPSHRSCHRFIIKSSFISMSHFHPTSMCLCTDASTQRLRIFTWHNKELIPPKRLPGSFLSGSLSAMCLCVGSRCPSERRRSDRASLWRCVSSTRTTTCPRSSARACEAACSSAFSKVSRTGLHFPLVWSRCSFDVALTTESISIFPWKLQSTLNIRGESPPNRAHYEVGDGFTSK